MNVQSKMNNLKPIIKKSLLAFSFLLLLIPLKAQDSESGTLVDKIIAKVDDYIVLKSELERSYLDVMSRGEYEGNQTRCNILEGLVINKVMVAKAEIDSVIVEEEMVDRNLDMRMNAMISQVGSEELIEQYYGKTIDEFKDELRDQIREQMLVENMRSTIIQGISVTPDEVRRFFKAIPQDSLPYFSTEVVVGQIVKKPEINEAERDKAEQFLYDLKAQIQAGADFEEMARTYSQGPSGKNGGNLGWTSRGQMVAPFEAAAMKLQAGEISDPVETDFGMHIVQLIERRGNEYNSRHILISHKYLEEDFEKAAEELDSIRTLILNDSLNFQDAAKEFSDDKETSGSGGYFIDPSGSNTVPVSELDAGLFFTIDSMGVGDITKPMKFTMRSGEEAMRIVYYKDRISPHQANLEQDYQKIQRAAKNAKQNRVLSDWLREAKDEVFIEVVDEYDYCNILK
jgi:peptidyl-prolyl cis-trans isomerase SurA